MVNVGLATSVQIIGKLGLGQATERSKTWQYL